jgi:hypothetical protein
MGENRRARLSPGSSILSFIITVGSGDNKLANYFFLHASEGAEFTHRNELVFLLTQLFTNGV